MDTSNDVVMKEQTTQETTLANIQPEVSTSIPADLTDPNPPPQVLDQQTSISQDALPGVTPAAAQHLTTSSQATRPSSIPPTTPAPPQKPVPHGGPTRQYLNQNITPHLLEGMKYLAMKEPEKPLAWLADFLKERSKQVEG